MTFEEDAKPWAEKEGAEIEKIPCSEEVRTGVRGKGAMLFHAYSTGAIEQHFTDLGAKLRDDE
jgi:hypothetical protein